MKWWLTIMGLCIVPALIASAVSLDRVDTYVQELLKTKEIASVVRPDGVANRLEVTFQEDVPIEVRAKQLQEIGSKFLIALFRDTQITTATVVERSVSGAVLNEQVVKMGEP